MIRTSVGFSHNLSVPQPINNYKFTERVKAIPYEKVRTSSQIVFGAPDSFNADIRQQIAIEDAAARMRDQYDNIGYVPKVQAQTSSKQYNLGSGGKNTINAGFHDYFKGSQTTSNLNGTIYVKQSAPVSFNGSTQTAFSSKSNHSQTAIKQFGEVFSQTNSRQLQDSGTQSKSKNFMDSVMQTVPIQGKTTEIAMRTDGGTQTKDSAMLISSAFEERRERKGKGRLIDTTPFNTQLSKPPAYVPFNLKRFKTPVPMLKFDRPLDAIYEERVGPSRKPKLIMDTPKTPPAVSSSVNMFTTDKDGIRKGSDNKGYEINPDLKRLKDNTAKAVKMGVRQRMEKNIKKKS